MNDHWTQQQLREIRHLAPNYGWQGTHEDGDVIRWINTRAPACLEEFKRQAEEASDAGAPPTKLGQRKRKPQTTPNSLPLFTEFE